MEPESHCDWTEIEEFDADPVSGEADWRSIEDTAWVHDPIDPEDHRVTASANVVEACEKADSRYPVLRSIVAEEFTTLSDDELSTRLAELTGLDAEDLERSFGGIGRLTNRTGNALSSAAPNMLRSAAAQEEIDPATGPAGAAAAVMAVQGLTLIRGMGARQRPVPRRISLQTGHPGQTGCRKSVEPMRPRLVPTGQTDSSPGTGARRNRSAPGMLVDQTVPPGTTLAAHMLISVLARPEVLRALMAAALGPAGRGSVPVARGQMRVGRLLAGAASAASGAADDAWGALAPLIGTPFGTDAFSRALDSRRQPRALRGTTSNDGAQTGAVGGVGP